MIHAIKLPDITRDRLQDVVRLQMHLLAFAACTPEIGREIKDKKEKAEAEKKKKEQLIRYFNTIEGFKMHGREIANWLWAAGTKTRHSHLEQFACTFSSKDVKEKEAEQKVKQAWCQRLSKEVEDLLAQDNKPLVVKPFYDEDQYSTKYVTDPRDLKKPASSGQEKQLLHWRTHAKNFLLYFYDFFLGGDEPFPAYFSTDPSNVSGEESFGRQDLLKAFLDENRGQEICATCNEARYYSQGEYIHAHLDHYLPKSDYPHFACHPYNLVPVCYFCNSPTKGRSDPFYDPVLKERRPFLSKETLPYHQMGLSQVAYLDVTPGIEARLVKIHSIKPRPGLTPQSIKLVEEEIKLMQELYDIPDRWNRDEQALKISDTLFRRMRHFIGDGQILSGASDPVAGVTNALKQLLYYLDNDDQQKDPFTFAMTWILGALLQEGDPQALVEEVNSWTGQSLEKSQYRHEQAEKLLKIVQKARKEEA